MYFDGLREPSQLDDSIFVIDMSFSLLVSSACASRDLARLDLTRGEDAKLHSQP